MSDDLRERLARAMTAHHTIPWDEMPEARKRRLLAYADAALADIGKPGPSVRKTEFAAMLAVHCNGGDWGTDYTEDQKNIWRDRAERLRKDPSAIEPAPVSVREAARVLAERLAAPFEHADMNARDIDWQKVWADDFWEEASERDAPAAMIAALRAIAEGKE